MKSREEIIKIARQTIAEEAIAVNKLAKYVDENFYKCVEVIYHATGRVIITGIGKSANIASKIVATLNSTGTSSVFLHAADAIHGDLGIVQKNDVIICVSKSGNTPEIKVLVPMLKVLGNKLIGLVGNMDSFLAKQADYVINTYVEKEASPNNLAPTSSTTAQLVMGDALAVCLLECKGFTTSDFARLHPGGSLGKQLYLRVSDLYTRNDKPAVDHHANVRDIIVEISSKRLGATAVLQDGKIVGIITDGDLRRMMEKYTNLNQIRAADIMSRNPKTIFPETLAVDALSIMRKNNITQLLVMNGESYLGVIHLHDLLNEGIL